ncbi:MAG TPA: nidogen-like domain-containing protein [Solirubrobacterales bacterium]|nr:nidogen-like domain-containing protein [Solirubrobacterales bacterium]
MTIPPASADAAGPNAVRNLAGCTANTLAANDDGSTESVPIGFEVDFFNNPHTTLYVNNNGNVTFDQPQGEFTPFDFTTSGDQMIAPFLADVDTRNAPGDGTKLVTFGQTEVAGQAAFCINWVDVGYYSVHVDKTNSFQLILIDRGSGDFDIEFNYDRVAWETGDASGGFEGFGGSSAAVGFANGDGDPSHFFVRDGSFENGALLDGGPKALISSSLNSGGQLGRYVFHVHSEPPTGATLTGEVEDPEGFPVAGAPVEICPVAAGKCIARMANGSGVYRATNLPAGSYEVTARSASASPAYADGHAGPVAVSGTSTFTQNVMLGPELGGPPPGTEIAGIGESEGGIPVLHWEASTELTTEGCANGTASYEVAIEGEVVQSGSMAESPLGSGFYRAIIPPLFPDHGNGQVVIEIKDCASPQTIEFAIYIDPSGVVKDADTGAAIAGATVTLFRSADADGPFIQVPDGSAIMSPANRNNPDSTGIDGRFGWDVIAGFYRVTASMEGCESATSGVLDIPPPVTDLVIRLDCGNGGSSGGGGGGGGGASLAPIAGTARPAVATPTPKKKHKRKCHGKKHKRKKCHKKKHGRGSRGGRTGSRLQDLLGPGPTVVAIPDVSEQKP